MAAGDETNKRYEGTVKWFNGRKGFGFIASADDATTDLFVHQSEIKAEGFRFLRDGEKVEFSVDTGEDGRKKAVDVVGFGRTRGYLQPGRVMRRAGGLRGRSRGGRYGGYRGGGEFAIGGGEGDGHGGRGGRDGGGPECYNCGRVGHFARDCYRGTGNYGGGDDQGYDNGRGRGRGRGGGRSRACYGCGEEGHFARECPNDQN